MRYPSGVTQRWERVSRTPGVVIVALLDDGRILLTRERRPLTGKWVWRAPMGFMEQGETPLAAAKRELREETGYTAKRWKRFASHRTGPRAVRLPSYVYLARELHRGEVHLDLSEEIQLHPVSFDRAVRMALDGTIDHEVLALNLLRYYDQVHRVIEKE